MSKRDRRYKRGYSIGGLPEQVIAYVLPWMLLLFVWPVTAGLHWWIGDNPLWMSFLAVGFVYLAYTTWQTWSARKRETRIMATVFITAVLTWALFAVTVRPWQADVFKAWALGGLVLCASWCLRHASLTGVHDHDKAREDEGSDSLLDKVRAFKNAKVKRVDESDQELRVTADLESGTTIKEAQDAKDQIAAVARVGSDQVKVLKVKGDDGAATIAFTRPVDNSKPLVWKGPRNLGRSCADAPVWLGRRDDGSDINWWIVGSNDPKNPRPLAHTKCTGVNGSGKTETICTGILGMREFIDLVPIVADPAKFRQSFGDIEDVLGLAAKDKRASKNLAVNLIDVIEYRAGLFGSLTRSDGEVGYKQWESELWTLHRIPALFVDIEEATDIIFAIEDDVDEIVRKLRSVGVHLCVSMQTMPHDNIPRKTRGQFAQSLAHGQTEMQDARYALDHETLEAGADPTKWRNNVPGSLYAEVTGTDKEHWPIDGRAVYMSGEDKKRSKAASREHWAEIDPGTYRILARGVVADPVEQEEPVLEGTVDDDFKETVPMSLTSKDGSIDLDVPLTMPDPNGPQVDFGGQQVSMSDDDARAMLMNHLSVMASGGDREVTFEALSEFPQQVGKPPIWVYEELEYLVELGILEKINPPNRRAVYAMRGSVHEEAMAGA